MPNGSTEQLSVNGKFVGTVLLLIVNVLWVLSSEITRFIFVDEDFKRPFFTAYIKSCLLSVYMVRYLACNSKEEKVYKVLDEEPEAEIFPLKEIPSQSRLSHEGFESLTDNSDNEDRPGTAVRFASRREASTEAFICSVVRRMPVSEALEARIARLPYNPADIMINCSISKHVWHTMFFFAPMWLICSFTYQSALLFTSVTSLNLISSSSSLFVLVLSICIPSAGSRFTVTKAFLVMLNLAGVVAVSQFASNLTGAILAQVSAIFYALYLTLLSRFQERNGEINMNLMFGSIGVLAVVIGSPMILILNATGIEPMYPLPNYEQLGSILVSAVFGTLLADYLWLMAAGLTDSLSASLSLTLSIPFSFLADSVFRQRPPTFVQLIAAIPITLSFIGAAYVENKSVGPVKEKRRSVIKSDDSELLLENME